MNLFAGLTASVKNQHRPGFDYSGRSAKPPGQSPTVRATGFSPAAQRQELNSQQLPDYQVVFVSRTPDGPSWARLYGAYLVVNNCMQYAGYCSDEQAPERRMWRCRRLAEEWIARHLPLADKLERYKLLWLS